MEVKIGKTISKLRSNKGLSQRDFASLIGVSNGAVGMWETNKRQPDLEMVLKIADYFNVSTDYLLGHKETYSNKNIQNSVLLDLSKKDVKIISSYKKLQPENQKRLEDYINILKVFEDSNSIVPSEDELSETEKAVEEAIRTQKGLDAKIG